MHWSYLCALFTAISVESHVAVRQAFVVQHHVSGAFSKSLENVWYPSSNAPGSTLIADLQALLAAGDDVLASQDDETSVVTIGDSIRIERLDVATLVVVSQRPHTFSSCQDVISSCTRVLKQCKSTVTAHSHLTLLSHINHQLLVADDVMLLFLCLAIPDVFHIFAVFILMRGLEGSRGMT